MQRVPLTAEIVRDQTNYLGRILEITGINSQGTTADEAYQNLLRATQGLLRYKLPDRTMADVLIVREDRKY